MFASSRRGSAVALLALSLIACDPDDEDAGEEDGGAPVDAGVAAEVGVPATSGQLDLPFSVALDGEGSTRVGAFSIADATGTIEIEGTPYPAVVYLKQPWPEAGYTLFQTLAVGDDRWYLLWFYCQAGSVVYIYSEATDGTPMAYENATGSCASLDTGITAAVALPASQLEIPELLAGYTVSGPDIDIASAQPGAISLGGVDYEVLPFEDVVCLDCGSSGWYELHALLVDPVGDRACFGIFYLTRGSPSSVLLTYSITVPDLSDPAGALVVPATWTTP